MKFNRHPTFLSSLGDVLWGDPWFTSRGVAYLALLFAASCLLAGWRARRIYRRYLHHNPLDMFAVRSEHAVLTEEHLKKMLRHASTTKFRMMLLWLVLASALLAAQAYELASIASQGIMVVLPDNTWAVPISVVMYYKTIGAWMTGIVAGLMLIWVYSPVIGDEEDNRHFKVRVINWLADLMDPIEPNAPVNRAQRVLVQLEPSVYLERKKRS